MTDPAPLADAELVAYLDGELDEAAARAVEARLAADPLARQKADAFRRSFALLDTLPRPAPPADFTAKTVTRLKVPGGSTGSLRPARPRRWGSLIAAAVVLAAGLGGALTRLAIRGDGTPLMADLPVIEGLPLYHAADDLGYVRQISGGGYFPVPAAGPFAPPDPAPEAREKLAAEFRRLPADHRQRVRTLHAELTALPPAERNRLGRVLERYAGWLDRLPPADREQVLAAPSADARLGVVENLLLSARRDALPGRVQSQLSTLRPAERAQLLADVQAAEKAADAEWAKAADHWRPLAAAGVKPFPFDEPGGAERVADFLKGVLAVPAGKPDDACRLSPAELIDLRARLAAATQDGQWFLYGLGVWRLAERHPSLPRHRSKPAVVHPRDLAELKLAPRLMTQLEKLPGVGRWPEFARQAAGSLGGKKLLPVPTDGFGPCRPGEFPDAVEAVLSELLPLLNDGERRRLKVAEGKWPEYPDLFVRLARERDRPVPSVTLPGPPSRWAATYAAPTAAGR